MTKDLTKPNYDRLEIFERVNILDFGDLFPSEKTSLEDTINLFEKKLKEYSLLENSFFQVKRYGFDGGIELCEYTKRKETDKEFETRIKREEKNYENQIKKQLTKKENLMKKVKEELSKEDLKKLLEE